MKQIIFIRHAHRDISDRKIDNGLSSKGIRQAARLKKFALLRFAFGDFRDGSGIISSSPKLRCIQTVEPLAKALDCKMQVRPELDERKANETLAQFNQRVLRYMKTITADRAGTVVICTHGDWLPLAIFHLLGINVEMKKGAWLEVKVLADRSDLTWYIPSFKSFLAV